MAASVINLEAENGQRIQFVDEIIASGGMKDVYFSPDRSYVVAFYRKELDSNALERLRNIVGSYRERMFMQGQNAYWSQLFCWPSALVKWNERWGVVCPTYDEQFFFQHGRLKGKEKQGLWFSSAHNRNTALPQEELGDWRGYIQICIEIARAVAHLHRFGVAHSDLSYNNVLINPLRGRATLIDCDGLVVRGKYPAEVLGTNDFIAPEVLATRRLASGDARKNTPTMQTDRHAMAVLFYLYLLYRHPLRGGKIWHEEAAVDEEMRMGEKAFFIEHPTDLTNRPNLKEIAPTALPYEDVNAIPYTVCGEILSSLFLRAFVDGLHNPENRPTADEWDEALVRTLDMLLPCSNPQCSHGWFVFDGKKRPTCPFCKTSYEDNVALLHFYYSPNAKDKPLYERRKMLVHADQKLHAWHVYRTVSASKALSYGKGKALVTFHRDGKRHWMARNEGCIDLHVHVETGNTKKVQIGEVFPLRDGLVIQLDMAASARFAVVQLAEK